MFTSFASWQFSIAGETVTTPLPMQLEDHVFDVLCPYRVLSPALNRAEGDMSGQTLGNSYSIKWALDDLLLWRTVLGVPSFSDVVMPLMDYMIAYAETWVRHRQITPQAFIERVNPFTAGIFEYPAGSGVRYYGVLATHIIRENVDG